MDIVIDDEFKSIIPPLSGDELRQLEDNILQDGIRDPLVLWGQTLIDGHNRYAISKRHGLTFKTVQIDFENRNEAKAWIAKNQLGRRNIDKITRYELALIAKPAIQAKAGEHLSDAGKHFGRGIAFDKNVKPYAPINTRKELSDLTGLSEGTISQIEKIKADAPELVPKIKAGDMTVGGAYMQIKRMNAPKRPDPVADARLEHESFSSKVESGEIVSVQEAKKDGENLAVMAKELSDRINKIQQDIFWIRKEMSMKEFAEMIKHLKDKDGMMRDLDEIIASANRLKMMVEENV